MRPGGARSHVWASKGTQAWASARSGTPAAVRLGVGPWPRTARRTPARQGGRRRGSSGEGGSPPPRRSAASRAVGAPHGPEGWPQRRWGAAGPDARRLDRWRRPTRRGRPAPHAGGPPARVFLAGQVGRAGEESDVGAAAALFLPQRRCRGGLLGQSAEPGDSVDKEPAPGSHSRERGCGARTHSAAAGGRPPPGGARGGSDCGAAAAAARGRRPSRPDSTGGRANETWPVSWSPWRAQPRAQRGGRRGGRPERVASCRPLKPCVRER